jgi:hypothetical protein
MSGYNVQVNTGIVIGQYNIHTWIQINKPDGTSEAYGFYPKTDSLGNMIYGPGDVKPEPLGASPTGTSGPMPITESQYQELIQYIKQSDITPPNYSLPLGAQCTNWAIKALAESGIVPRVLGPDMGFGPLQTLIWNPVLQQAAWFYRDLFTRAKNWQAPRDPLILDLNGNGLETVGLAANIHFDHDGDGVLTKTGWSGKHDALLVWDRNANGTIDTGAELFGDFTALPNGTLAPNGFAALAALDTNGDGILDAADPAFAELKLWRDASQDGVSQGGEFITLAEAGIVSLNLANTLKNLVIGNGNTLSREGSFTRADGTVGGMGEFNLATDTFDTRFADAITVPAALQSLPNMAGSGNVRDLHQAAAQSAAVAELLTQFQAAPTHGKQMALIDQLISAWAGSAGMVSTLEERIAGAYRIQYEFIGNQYRTSNFDAAALVAAASTLGNSSALMSDAGNPIISAYYRNLTSEWSRKLAVLEAFNGQYFFNLSANKSQIEGANDSLWECAA